MCIPAAMLAMSVGSTAMKIRQANKEAQAMGDAANRANALNQKALATAQNETADKASLEAMERQRQGMRERGRIQAATSASGIGGNLSQMALANSMFQEGYDTGIINSDAESEIDSIHSQRQAANLNTSSRVESARNQSINPFMGSLMIGGSAASGWTEGKQLERQWR
jgi:hypothetical protein